MVVSRAMGKHRVLLLVLVLVVWLVLVLVLVLVRVWICIGAVVGGKGCGLCGWGCKVRGCEWGGAWKCLPVRVLVLQAWLRWFWVWAWLVWVLLLAVVLGSVGLVQVLVLVWVWGLV